MGISAAGAALIAAAVVCPVTGDAVVAANRLTAVVCTLAVTGASATKAHTTTARGAAAAASNRRADIASAFQPAAAVRTTEAGSTLVAATVQRTIAGNPVVSAGDRPTVLVAFTRSSALATEPDRTPTGRGAVSTDSTLAPRVPAALGVCGASTAPTATAIQGASAIVRAGDGTARLATLAGLGASLAGEQPGRAVVDAAAFHTVQTSTAVCAVTNAAACPALVAAAVEWTISVITVVGAGSRSTGLGALRGRCALSAESQPPRWSGASSRPATGSIDAVNASAAVNIAAAGAAAVATTVPFTVGGKAVTGADN